MTIKALKKNILIIFILILMVSTAALLAGCGGDKEETKPVYTVRLSVEGMFSTYIKVAEGDTIASQLSYTNKQKAWYTSKNGDIEWNIYKDVVTCDMTLYARASE